MCWAVITVYMSKVKVNIRSARRIQDSTTDSYTLHYCRTFCPVLDKAIHRGIVYPPTKTIQNPCTMAVAYNTVENGDMLCKMIGGVIKTRSRYTASSHNDLYKDHTNSCTR